MKKKIVISLIVALILFTGVFGFILFNNRIVSTITLDINPSIEIGLDKKHKVRSVLTINDEAKDIVSNSLKGKNLDDTLRIITDKLIEKGYASHDDLLEIIIYSEGNISSKEIENKLNKTFEEKNIDSNIIVIDKILKEDKELSKKYNISPAKASYIKSITKDNEEINIENLIDKSVEDLHETKVTGKYCDKGYTLEGDWCLKEKERIAASRGEICSVGYLEYEGKCYLETPSEETGKLLCRSGFKLEGKECIKKTTVAAIVAGYTCSRGEVRTKGEVGQAVKGSGVANDPVCVDPSSKTHPVSPCQLPASDPTERMSSGGKCYWHRAPVIAEGCPGKIKINGFCWDDATNVYLCPNGNNSNPRTKDDYCYTVLKNVKPTPSTYKCDGEMTLNGNKCESNEKEEAMPERVCPSGYTLVNNDRCINYNKIISKENGYICNQKNARLKDDKCVIYEMIEAKHS